jgi:hypothetical protein
MKATNKRGFLLAMAALLLVLHASPSRAAAREPVLTTPHFAFHSDFDVNLNDALIAAGLARKHAKPELFRSGEEVPCFGGLPQSTKTAWDKAVDYYAEIISPGSFGDRSQYLVRAQLAGFDEDLKDAKSKQFVEIVRSFRAAAAPAYTECRWKAQDEKNRRWIEDMKARLAAYEEKIAPRLEQLYRQHWTGLPVPVDVVETVDWSGANTVFRDLGGGHILISTAYEGPSALEAVFHEASHLLMGRGAPIQKALVDAASAVEFHLPGDLWHVVLFYTTGEAVRHIFDGDGRPGYEPMLYGIFGRGGWVEYREALETQWRPYVEGKRDLPDAAACLIDALRKPEDGSPRPTRCAAGSSTP